MKNKQRAILLLFVTLLMTLSACQKVPGPRSLLFSVCKDFKEIKGVEGEITLDTAVSVLGFSKKISLASAYELSLTSRKLNLKGDLFNSSFILPANKALTFKEKITLLKELNQIVKDFEVKEKEGFYQVSGKVPVAFILDILPDNEELENFIKVNEIIDKDINVTFSINKETKELSKIVIKDDSIIKALKIVKGEFLTLTHGILTISIDDISKE